MDQAIIEKLQKVMALAACKGATQGEMEAAMARAQEIAMKHGIELASLPAREESRSRLAVEIETNTGLKLSTRYEHPYHNWVFVTLERCLGVNFLMSRGRLGSHPYLHKIWIIGDPCDVALAIALFPWLEETFPRLFGQAVKSGAVPDRSFACMNGFYMGLANGLEAANKRKEAALSAEDRSKWALVVLSKQDLIKAEVDKLTAWKKGKKERKDRKGYDSGAYYNGQEKGKTIKLGQMGAGAPAAGHLE